MSWISANHTFSFDQMLFFFPFFWVQRLAISEQSSIRSLTSRQRTATAFAMIEARENDGAVSGGSGLCRPCGAAFARLAPLRRVKIDNRSGGLASATCKLSSRDVRVYLVTDRRTAGASVADVVRVAVKDERRVGATIVQ